MFYGNEIKQQNKIYGLSKKQIVVFYYQVSIAFLTSQKLCVP